MKDALQRLEQNKKWLITALISAFIWGMAAHGYAFFNNSFSHDSLREFHSEILGNDIKMGLGRVFAPIYRDLIGSDVTLPWLTGMLALLWIGLAVFLLIRIFHVESKLIAFLIAGIFSTNITVSATTATYIHDLDSYMFSMLCAVAAAYLWNLNSRGWLFGTIMIALSLGIYQGNLFTTVVLAMIVCIFELLNEVGFKTVFQKGLKAIAMILLGGLLYFLSMKGILYLAGLELSMDDYNSLGKMTMLDPSGIGKLIVGAYADCFARLFHAYSSYPSILVKGMTVFFLVIDIAALTVGICRKQLSLIEKALCICLIVLLPLGMNMIYVLMQGATHDLMVFPIWLFYLLTLLLTDWLCRRLRSATSGAIVSLAGKWQKLLCMLLIGVLLYGNVRFSNGMYMKKNLEFDATLSIMTRVIGRMEAFDGYVPGETPVAFVGLPKAYNRVIPGFKDYWNVTGMTGSNVIYTMETSRFQAYFDYILSVPIMLVEDEIRNEIISRESVQEMPCYPTDGFMTFHDGILIVKLGEVPL